MPNAVTVQSLVPQSPLADTISPSIVTPDDVPNGKPKTSPSNDPVITAVGGNECPKWIADKLGIPVEEVSHLEVTCSAKIAYEALLEYLAITSVDATRKPPGNIDATVDNPESPGRLSTLWTGPGKGVIEGSDPDEPDKAEYRLGLGYARALADGQDVFIIHIARGNPIQVYYKARLYRALLLFASNPASLKKLTDDALVWKNQNDKKKRLAKPGKYVLYTLTVEECGDVHWRNHGQKDARPLNSIFLRKGQQDAIVADFKSFRKSTTKKWYLEHGLPYRRSYLFYGPPGVGKTSLIRGLAGELKLTTCFMCLADKKMGNAQLQDALRSIPKPSMIVLEDVDVLFNEDRKSQTEASLTFSGLLNALDGLISADGILTVMTTNHIERLDPALVRAGRVDRRFEFTPPDREQVASLFQSYYPDAEQGMAKKFAEMVFSREEKSARSIATLQQHFVYTRENNAEESLEMLPEFFKEFYPDNLRDPSKHLYV